MIRKLLQTMRHRRAVFTAEEENVFSSEELADCLRQYVTPVEEELTTNPVRGKYGRMDKGKSHWYRDFKDDIPRSARDRRVHFTNNNAERVIRWAKQKDKVCGYFRSQDRADQFTKPSTTKLSNICVIRSIP